MSTEYSYKKWILLSKSKNGSDNFKYLGSFSSLQIVEMLEISYVYVSDLIWGLGSNSFTSIYEASFIPNEAFELKKRYERFVANYTIRGESPVCFHEENNLKRLL